MKDLLKALSPYIDIDPDRRGGRPVLKGTRFKLVQLLETMAAGQSIREIATFYDLDRNALRWLVAALIRYFDQPFTEAGEQSDDPIRE